MFFSHSDDRKSFQIVLDNGEGDKINVHIDSNWSLYFNITFENRNETNYEGGKGENYEGENAWH